MCGSHKIAGCVQDIQEGVFFCFAMFRGRGVATYKLNENTHWALCPKFRCVHLVAFQILEWRGGRGEEWARPHHTPPLEPCLSQRMQNQPDF